MTRQYCVTTSGTTNEQVWEEVRLVYGPTNFNDDGVLDVRDDDIAEFTTWSATYPGVAFADWLVWRLMRGTAEYKNLPRNDVRLNKVGHSFSPCPYSTEANDVRSQIMLGQGFNLGSKVTHQVGNTVYYMKTAYRGHWGYECTLGNLCPGYGTIAANTNYFYA